MNSVNVTQRVNKASKDELGLVSPRPVVPVNKEQDSLAARG